jgi:ParB/RepB/Spo0J family partition protein
MKKAKNSSAAVVDAPLQNQDSTESRPTMGEFKMLPRAMVRPDPNQPRKVFDETKLAELAESIRLNGILSPLVVQKVPAKVKIEEPDLTHDDWRVIDAKGEVLFQGNEGPCEIFAGEDAEDYYQIIFGERRWRAAELAGLSEVPVMVRELTEREVFQQQFIENNQRENLSALEEAKAFQDRIAREKETDPTFNADKLAEILGIARATVYNRLTLTRLTAPVIDALQSGKIQTTVAGLIAMIPDPAQQEKLLAKLTNEDDWEFPFSFRDVERIIEDRYCKQLKDAPFDLHADNLVGLHEKLDGTPLYGGACATCVMRSGNMREDFPHIKNLNVCTKPECYAEKCKVHFADEAAEAERKGQKVLSEKEFKKVKGQYARSGDYSGAEGSYYKSWDEMLGKKMPPAVAVLTSEGLKQFYPKEELIALAEAKGETFGTSVKPLSKEQREQEEEKRKQAAALLERRQELVVELAPELLKCLGKLNDKLAWELAGEMVTSLDWPQREMEAALVDKAKGSRVKVLARCFADGEWYPVHHSGDWNDANVEFWKRAGVDLVAEEQKRVLADGHQALPLKKAEAKQKELLAVKKNKKKTKKK